MRIIFFGTSTFAAIILNHLLKKHLDIVAVVTRPDSPQGRFLKIGASPVKELLLRSYPEKPLLQPVKASTVEFTELITVFRPDLFVVAAYGEILKSSLLNIPVKGAINIHGSLLPRYRGAAPIQRSLMDGEHETGITIIKMVLKMDAGDILAMKKIGLTGEENFGEVEQKLAEITGPTLLDVITKIDNGTAESTPQDHSAATLAPKITPAECEIQWTEPAMTLNNLVRALSPEPGAWCWVQIGTHKKKLKIKKSEYVAVEKSEKKAGDSVILDRKEWVIQCGEGGLRVKELQLREKRR